MLLIGTPSLNSLLSNRLMLDIFLEAGLPDNIINFNVMDVGTFSNEIINHNIGGIIYNGLAEDYSLIKISSIVFIVQSIMTIYCNPAYNIKENHIAEPRLIAECQGNNFHFIEESADEIKQLRIFARMLLIILDRTGYPALDFTYQPTC